jgi:hypothetical protein
LLSCDNSGFSLSNEQYEELLSFNNQLNLEVKNNRAVLMNALSECVKNDDSIKADSAIREFLISVSTARIVFYNKLLEFIPEYNKSELVYEQSEIEELRSIPVGQLFA